MKRVAFGITVTVILILYTVTQAQASSFLRINVDGTILACDNSAALCGAGFTTVIGSNSIQFSGTVNGVAFGSSGTVGLQLTGNGPGTPAIAFILDTKTSITNSSGASRTVTIDVGQNNFTQPVGPGLLSASQAANWTISTAGDSQSLQSWLRNTNDFVIPTGTATVITPNCISPGGLTQSCNAVTGDLPVNSTAPFALTSREVLNFADGTIFSGSGTTTLTAAPTPAPEPSSIVLLGTGMLLLAFRQWKKDKK